MQLNDVGRVQPNVATPATASSAPSNEAPAMDVRDVAQRGLTDSSKNYWKFWKRTELRTAAAERSLQALGGQGDGATRNAVQIGTLAATRLGQQPATRLLLMRETLRAVQNGVVGSVSSLAGLALTLADTATTAAKQAVERDGYRALLETVGQCAASAGAPHASFVAFLHQLVTAGADAQTALRQAAQDPPSSAADYARNALALTDSSATPAAVLENAVGLLSREPAQDAASTQWQRLTRILAKPLSTVCAEAIRRDGLQAVANGETHAAQTAPARLMRLLPALAGASDADKMLLAQDALDEAAAAPNETAGRWLQFRAAWNHAVTDASSAPALLFAEALAQNREANAANLSAAAQKLLDQTPGEGRQEVADALLQAIGSCAQAPPHADQIQLLRGLLAAGAAPVQVLAQCAAPATTAADRAGIVIALANSAAPVLQDGLDHIERLASRDGDANTTSHVQRHGRLQGGLDQVNSGLLEATLTSIANGTSYSATDAPQFVSTLLPTLGASERSRLTAIAFTEAESAKPPYQPWLKLWHLLEAAANGAKETDAGIPELRAAVLAQIVGGKPADLKSAAAVAGAAISQQPATAAGHAAASNLFREVERCDAAPSAAHASFYQTVGALESKLSSNDAISIKLLSAATAAAPNAPDLSQVPNLVSWGRHLSDSLGTPQEKLACGGAVLSLLQERSTDPIKGWLVAVQSGLDPMTEAADKVKVLDALWQTMAQPPSTFLEFANASNAIASSSSQAVAAQRALCPVLRQVAAAPEHRTAALGLELLQDFANRALQDPADQADAIRQGLTVLAAAPNPAEGNRLAATCNLLLSKRRTPIEARELAMSAITLMARQAEQAGNRDLSDAAVLLQRVATVPDSTDQITACLRSGMEMLEKPPRDAAGQPLFTVAPQPAAEGNANQVDPLLQLGQHLLKAKLPAKQKTMVAQFLVDLVSQRAERIHNQGLAAAARFLSRTAALPLVSDDTHSAVLLQGIQSLAQNAASPLLTLTNLTSTAAGQAKHPHDQACIHQLGLEVIEPFVEGAEKQAFLRGARAAAAVKLAEPAFEAAVASTATSAFNNFAQHAEQSQLSHLAAWTESMVGKSTFADDKIHLLLPLVDALHEVALATPQNQVQNRSHLLHAVAALPLRNEADRAAMLTQGLKSLAPAPQNTRNETALFGQNLINWRANSQVGRHPDDILSIANQTLQRLQAQREDNTLEGDCADYVDVLAGVMQLEVDSTRKADLATTALSAVSTAVASQGDPMLQSYGNALFYQGRSNNRQAMAPIVVECALRRARRLHETELLPGLEMLSELSRLPLPNAAGERDLLVAYGIAQLAPIRLQARAADAEEAPPDLASARNAAAGLLGLASAVIRTTADPVQQTVLYQLAFRRAAAAAAADPAAAATLRALQQASTVAVKAPEARPTALANGLATMVQTLAKTGPLQFEDFSPTLDGVLNNTRNSADRLLFSRAFVDSATALAEQTHNAPMLAKLQLLSTAATRPLADRDDQAYALAAGLKAPATGSETAAMAAAGSAMIAAKMARTGDNYPGDTLMLAHTTVETLQQLASTRHDEALLRGLQLLDRLAEVRSATDTETSKVYASCLNALCNVEKVEAGPNMAILNALLENAQPPARLAVAEALGAEARLQAAQQKQDRSRHVALLGALAVGTWSSEAARADAVVAAALTLTAGVGPDAEGIAEMAYAASENRNSAADVLHIVNCAFEQMAASTDSQPLRVVLNRLQRLPQAGTDDANRMQLARNALLYAAECPSGTARELEHVAADLQSHDLPADVKQRAAALLNEGTAP